MPRLRRRHVVAVYPRRLVNHDAAADYLDISPLSIRTASWRRKLGIPTVKFGAVVRYDLEQLDEWIATRRQGVVA
jgi:hypothetical protein